MEFTPDYMKATAIIFPDTTGVANRRNPKMYLYKESDVSMSTVLDAYGMTENDILNTISKELKHRWPTSIQLISYVQQNFGEPLQPTGTQTVNWWGNPCGSPCTSVNSCIELCVTDNYGQEHRTELLSATGSNTGEKPPGRVLNEIVYSGYTKCNDIKYELDESLFQLCDYDIRCANNRVHPVSYKIDAKLKAVEKENSELKETVRRLESKMATIMEFMLMMK